MSFWQLLFLAMLVLWAQALVIFVSALHSLRERFRNSWDTALFLEARCLELLQESTALTGEAQADGEALAKMRAALERRLYPEEGRDVALLAEIKEGRERLMEKYGALLEARHRGLGLPLHAGVAELRARNAYDAYVAGLSAYEARRVSGVRFGWEPAARWLGYKPYSAVGMFRNPR